MNGLYRVDNLIAYTKSLLYVIQDQIVYRTLVESYILYRHQSTSALQRLSRFYYINTFSCLSISIDNVSYTISFGNQLYC